MPKRVAIVQSSYIPWKGYFDLIRCVDEFILLDDVQYTRRDWRNRNTIKTPRGLQWLTIPVLSKHQFTQRICDTKIDSPSWAASHWKAITTSYAKAPHFKSMAPALEAYYTGTPSDSLSQENRKLLEILCDLLGIKTPLRWSMDLPIQAETPTARLVTLCQKVGAQEYVSGPSAQDYLEESLFTDAGIRLRYADYNGYPVYHQMHGDFIHTVSVLDLLFNEGAQAPQFLKDLV